MAELNYIERETIESFLGLRDGYIFEFTNKTFQAFVFDSVKLDIYSEKYHFGSNSKANLLRGFINAETNYNVGKLLKSLCDYWFSKVQSKQYKSNNSKENLYEQCIKIAERLKSESIVENLDALKPNNEDKDFELLAKSLRESIEKNEPETALDRLHTFLVKYFRALCEKHKIDYVKDESLNSLFGKYVKVINTEKIIDSIMTEKILKFSINIIEAFNDVRNNKSFAHDNPILNYQESILIFNNISNTIKFIEHIENIREKVREKDDDWELLF